jgi:cellulose synthase/poly-beta-1,6-N-acetylglucosamine synthase-like glycosyltransferase
MIAFIALWITLGLLSVGVTGFHFLSMSRASRKPWNLKIDKEYMPKVSILIPTFNESAVIKYKLVNLSKVDYPKNLMQIVIVDSKSADGTLEIINTFMEKHPELQIQVITEDKRKGKAAALNSVLPNLTDEVVIVSDADCLYPNDILRKSLPYLSDPKVGALSGPKLLLNSHYSRNSSDERNYLESMNRIKLGESKIGFTPLFEGGFSAYKREMFESFDPYKTGSDDCGTVIKLAEKSLQALFVPEAVFFTTFPLTWKERLSIKLRRGNQLLRVFGKYSSAYINGKIKSAKRVILSDILVYLFCPTMFVMFLIATVGLFLLYPYLTLTLLVLLIPKVRHLTIELCQNYIILFVSIFSVLLKRSFLIWKQPADRLLFTEGMLKQENLI